MAPITPTTDIPNGAEITKHKRFLENLRSPVIESRISSDDDEEDKNDDTEDFAEVAS